MKSNHSVLEREIRAAFDAYLQAYFTERDYEKTISMFHPQISCIGTAGDETALNREECLVLYQRDISQCPEPIIYEMDFLQVFCPMETTGIVMAKMDIAGNIQGVSFNIDHLRMTLVLIKLQERWLLQHLHISQEQSNLETGEAYPLKEIEEKNRLLEQLIQQRTQELTRALQIIETAAITDNLTGIYNRRKFDDVLQYELQRVKRFSKPMALILGDVDFFKQVNDEHGHLVGDEMLKIISRILSQNVRQVDILARWGGEEFIVLLPETSGSEAAIIAEKLRRLVVEDRNEYQIALTMSFGVAEYVQGDDEDSLLKKADLALYRAKDQGRNRVVAEV